MRFVLIVMTSIVSSLHGSMAQAATAARGQGAAGSLLIVEEGHALPLVHVVVATRTGSSSDPASKIGLMNFAAEAARRGAAGRSREQLDGELDALGATLDVLTDADSVRFEGQVLTRNLDRFLELVAAMIVRPDFKAAEVDRTRREIEGELDEMRNDDRALCDRFFTRNVYGPQHPYGQPPDGTRASLERIRRDELASHFRAHFVGRNLIFAAAGDVTLASFGEHVQRAFARLKEGPAPRQPTMPAIAAPRGWRVQLVDKPDRQQTQIMFGHPTLPASHPDALALQLALASFGGHGMNATLMDEVRTKRGLAYGAYMGMVPRRRAGAIAGWVFSGAERTVATLKLVLNLYTKLMDKGLQPARLRFMQSFVVGSYASDMDSPERRLEARVNAEIAGLPGDHVDTYAERIKALTPDAVNAAIKHHIKARDLAITLVASAGVMKKLLTDAKIDPAAIDVVPFDSM